MRCSRLVRLSVLIVPGVALLGCSGSATRQAQAPAWSVASSQTQAQAAPPRAPGAGDALGARLFTPTTQQIARAGDDTDF